MALQLLKDEVLLREGSMSGGHSFPDSLGGALSRLHSLVGGSLSLQNIPPREISDGLTLVKHGQVVDDASFLQS